MTKQLFLTDAQLKSELKRCEYCEEKPCRTGCPANCSPCDFIMAATEGEKFDYKRAAAEILTANPLGGVCGLVCPDKHCMAQCTRIKFDNPINIPSIQAVIVAKAKKDGNIPKLEAAKPNGKKVAIVGAGPAGVAAALTLSQKGYAVTIFEKEGKGGGSAALIPDHRLPKDVIDSDLKFAMQTGNIKLVTNTRIEAPTELKNEFDGVILAAGLQAAIKPGIPGDDQVLYAYDYLRTPEKYKATGCVAVVGGGAIATDCAVTAKLNGAESVEMFVLETIPEMPILNAERKELLENGININSRTKILSIEKEDGLFSINTVKVRLKGEKFSLANLEEISGTEIVRNDFSQIIYAIGNRKEFKIEPTDGIIAAGDYRTGPTTVVEAVASGKNAAVEMDAYLQNQPIPTFKKHVKSYEKIAGYNKYPVSLETDFFGRKIRSPFILSAAPPSDGYEQMKKAYEAGWSGGIMKTAFDDVDIHIPAGYMHLFEPSTFGNCDNVSGHHLSRVCKEVAQLVKEYPDRLTIASTGGPVTGHDEADKKQWQKNTAMLEEAGAMAIEYSLSCPQGGDGTEGDIVSQNPALTAKIIDWVMQTGRADVPKLFKLTAQVTSIKVILNAIKEVFDRYPEKKAGITLANTFPTMYFRKGDKKEWEEGIIVGMSGRGVAPISNLTLSQVGSMGIHISGNGGPMSYKEAAHFLALGVKTVQFCTIAMKYGYGIIDELHEGISHMMAERGISSMDELIGRALPKPVTDFMELTPVKQISTVDKELCVNCGNCTRCSYQALSLNEEKVPETDPSKCIGCGICVKKCIAGALSLRDRTPHEAEVLKED